jgi:hypothetical protein
MRNRAAALPWTRSSSNSPEGAFGAVPIGAALILTILNLAILILVVLVIIVE